MGKRISLFVSGLILGAVVMLVIPAGAHHKNSAALLELRIDQLEGAHDEFVDSMIEILQYDLYPRTDLMDPETGSYLGYVHNSQTWSDYCIYGDDAVFDEDEYGDGILSCAYGPYRTPSRWAKPRDVAASVFEQRVEAHRRLDASKYKVGR